MPNTDPVEIALTADPTSLVQGLEEGKQALQEYTQETYNLEKASAAASAEWNREYIPTVEKATSRTFALTKESTNLLSSVLGVRLAVNLTERALKAMGVENDAVTATLNAMATGLEIVATALIIARALHLQKAAAAFADAISTWFAASANAALITFGLGAIAVTAIALGTLATLGALKIPGFAAGGIVTRPTIAMVGEAGPEAIVPLNRGGGTTYGDMHITQNIYSNDPDYIARQLARFIERQKAAGY